LRPSSSLLGGSAAVILWAPVISSVATLPEVQHNVLAVLACARRDIALIMDGAVLRLELAISQEFAIQVGYYQPAV